MHERESMHAGKARKTNANVVYRATRADGREVELRLVIAPEEATVVDAWARLSAIHAGLDPRTLEIEVRLAVAAPVARLRDHGERRPRGVPEIAHGA